MINVNIQQYLFQFEQDTCKLPVPNETTTNFSTKTDHNAANSAMGSSRELKDLLISDEKIPACSGNAYTRYICDREESVKQCDIEQMSVRPKTRRLLKPPHEGTVAINRPKSLPGNETTDNNTSVKNIVLYQQDQNCQPVNKNSQHEERIMSEQCHDNLSLTDFSSPLLLVPVNNFNKVICERPFLYEPDTGYLDQQNISSNSSSIIHLKFNSDTRLNDCDQLQQYRCRKLHHDDELLPKEASVSPEKNYCVVDGSEDNVSAEEKRLLREANEAMLDRLKSVGNFSLLHDKKYP